MPMPEQRRKELRSRTEELLRGRQLPGMRGKIVAVLKHGTYRIVRTSLGESLIIDKKALMEKFNSALSIEQRRTALRTVKMRRDGTVQATIGGLKKGKTRIYRSATEAIQEIQKHYGPYIR